MTESQRNAFFALTLATLLGLFLLQPVLSASAEGAPAGVSFAAASR